MIFADDNYAPKATLDALFLTRLQAKLDAPPKSNAQAACDHLMSRRRKFATIQRSSRRLQPWAGQAQGLHPLGHDECPCLNWRPCPSERASFSPGDCGPTASLNSHAIWLPVLVF